MGVNTVNIYEESNIPIEQIILDSLEDNGLLLGGSGNTITQLITNSMSESEKSALVKLIRKHITDTFKAMGKDVYSTASGLESIERYSKRAGIDISKVANQGWEGGTVLGALEQLGLMAHSLGGEMKLIPGDDGAFKISLEKIGGKPFEVSAQIGMGGRVGNKIDKLLLATVFSDKKVPSLKLVNGAAIGIGNLTGYLHKNGFDNLKPGSGVLQMLYERGQSGRPSMGAKAFDASELVDEAIGETLPRKGKGELTAHEVKASTSYSIANWIQSQLRTSAFLDAINKYYLQQYAGRDYVKKAKAQGKDIGYSHVKHLDPYNVDKSLVEAMINAFHYSATGASEKSIQSMANDSLTKFLLTEETLGGVWKSARDFGTALPIEYTSMTEGSHKTGNVGVMSTVNTTPFGTMTDLSQRAASKYEFGTRELTEDAIKARKEMGVYKESLVKEQKKVAAEAKHQVEGQFKMIRLTLEQYRAAQEKIGVDPHNMRDIKDTILLGDAARKATLSYGYALGNMVDDAVGLYGDYFNQSELESEDIIGFKEALKKNDTDSIIGLRRMPDGGFREIIQRVKNTKSGTKIMGSYGDHETILGSADYFDKILGAVRDLAGAGDELFSDFKGLDFDSVHGIVGDYGQLSTRTYLSVLGGNMQTMADLATQEGGIGGKEFLSKLRGQYGDIVDYMFSLSDDGGTILEKTSLDPETHKLRGVDKNGKFIDLTNTTTDKKGISINDRLKRLTSDILSGKAGEDVFGVKKFAPYKGIMTMGLKLHDVADYQEAVPFLPNGKLKEKYGRVKDDYKVKEARRYSEKAVRESFLNAKHDLTKKGKREAFESAKRGFTALEDYRVTQDKNFGPKAKRARKSIKDLQTMYRTLEGQNYVYEDKEYENPTDIEFISRKDLGDRELQENQILLDEIENLGLDNYYDKEAPVHNLIKRDQYKETPMYKAFLKKAELLHKKGSGVNRGSAIVLNRDGHKYLLALRFGNTSAATYDAGDGTKGKYIMPSQEDIISSRILEASLKSDEEFEKVRIAELNAINDIVNSKDSAYSKQAAYTYDSYSGFSTAEKGDYIDIDKYDNSKTSEKVKKDMRKHANTAYMTSTRFKEFLLGNDSVWENMDPTEEFVMRRDNVLNLADHFIARETYYRKNHSGKGSVAEETLKKIKEYKKKTRGLKRDANKDGAEFDEANQELKQYSEDIANAMVESIKGGNQYYGVRVGGYPYTTGLEGNLMRVGIDDTADLLSDLIRLLPGMIESIRRDTDGDRERVALDLADNFAKYQLTRGSQTPDDAITLMDIMEAKERMMQFGDRFAINMERFLHEQYILEANEVKAEWEKYQMDWEKSKDPNKGEMLSKEEWTKQYNDNAGNIVEEITLHSELNARASAEAKDAFKSVGMFSNSNTNMRTALHKLGYDEVFTKDSDGGNTGLLHTFEGGMMRSLLEGFEQDAISSKKIYKRLKNVAKDSGKGDEEAMNTAYGQVAELSKLVQSGDIGAFLQRSDELGILSGILRGRQIGTTMSFFLSMDNFGEKGGMKDAIITKYGEFLSPQDQKKLTKGELFTLGKDSNGKGFYEALGNNMADDLIRANPDNFKGMNRTQVLQSMMGYDEKIDPKYLASGRDRNKDIIHQDPNFSNKYADLLEAERLKAKGINVDLAKLEQAQLVVQEASTITSDVANGENISNVGNVVINTAGSVSIGSGGAGGNIAATMTQASNALNEALLIVAHGTSEALGVNGSKEGEIDVAPTLDSKEWAKKLVRSGEYHGNFVPDAAGNYSFVGGTANDKKAANNGEAYHITGLEGQYKLQTQYLNDDMVAKNTVPGTYFHDLQEHMAKYGYLSIEEFEKKNSQELAKIRAKYAATVEEGGMGSEFNVQQKEIEAMATASRLALVTRLGEEAASNLLTEKEMEWKIGDARFKGTADAISFTKGEDGRYNAEIIDYKKSKGGGKDDKYTQASRYLLASTYGWAAQANLTSLANRISAAKNGQLDSATLSELKGWYKDADLAQWAKTTGKGDKSKTTYNTESIAKDLNARALAINDARITIERAFMDGEDVITEFATKGIIGRNTTGHYLDLMSEGKGWATVENLDSLIAGDEYSFIRTNDAGLKEVEDTFSKDVKGKNEVQAKLIQAYIKANNRAEAATKKYTQYTENKPVNGTEDQMAEYGRNLAAYGTEKTEAEKERDDAMSRMTDSLGKDEANKVISRETAKHWLNAQESNKKPIEERSKDLGALYSLMQKAQLERNKLRTQLQNALTPDDYRVIQSRLDLNQQYIDSLGERIEETEGSLGQTADLERTHGTGTTFAKDALDTAHKTFGTYKDGEYKVSDTNISYADKVASLEAKAQGENPEAVQTFETYKSNLKKMYEALREARSIQNQIDAINELAEANGGLTDQDKANINEFNFLKKFYEDRAATLRGYNLANTRWYDSKQRTSWENEELSTLTKEWTLDNGRGFAGTRFQDLLANRNLANSLAALIAGAQAELESYRLALQDAGKEADPLQVALREKQLERLRNALKLTESEFERLQNAYIGTGGYTTEEAEALSRILNIQRDQQENAARLLNTVIRGANIFKDPKTGRIVSLNWSRGEWLDEDYDAGDHAEVFPITDSTVRGYLAAQKQIYAIDRNIQTLSTYQGKNESPALIAQRQATIASMQQQKSVLQGQYVFDQKAGTLNGRKMDQQAINDLIAEQNSMVAEQAVALGQITEALKPQISLWGTLKQSIAYSAKTFLSFSLGQAVISKITQSVKLLVQITAELDSKMVNLQIAIGGTREETKSLLSDYTSLADQLGTTTTAVADAANSWYRSGFRGQEAVDLTKYSMQLSTLGGIESGLATSYLVSAMKGWKLSVEEVSEVVDKLVTIDMNAVILPCLYSNM